MKSVVSSALEEAQPQWEGVRGGRRTSFRGITRCWLLAHPFRVPSEKAGSRAVSTARLLTSVTTSNHELHCASSFFWSTIHPFPKGRSAPLSTLTVTFGSKVRDGSDSPSNDLSHKARHLDIGVPK